MFVMAKKTPRRPALFNPKLVCALALLFTPIFGAALQARNWTELGRPDEAAATDAMQTCPVGAIESVDG